MEREDAEDVEKKRKRAARFGTEYVAPDETGMMDVGASQRQAVPRSVIPLCTPLARRSSLKPPTADTAPHMCCGRSAARPAACEPGAARRTGRPTRAETWLTRSLAHARPARAADLLEARMEAAAEVARRPDAVHLYGVDLLSTAECLGYFEGYGPTCVEWLDDSSCNVLFGDAGSAARAIAGRGRPLPPDADGAAPDHAGARLARGRRGPSRGGLLAPGRPECVLLFWRGRRGRPWPGANSLLVRGQRTGPAMRVPLAAPSVGAPRPSARQARRRQSGCCCHDAPPTSHRCAGSPAGLDPTDPRNMPRLWHKGEDFVKGGTPVPLLFRMATVADVKPPKGTKMSRFLWKAAPARKARVLCPVRAVSVLTQCRAHGRRAGSLPDARSGF